MEALQGKRNNTNVFVHQDHSYHLDKRSGKIYRCSKRKVYNCSGVLIPNGNTYTLKKSHNHLPQSNLLNILKLKRKMRDVAVQSFISNKEIFDSVSREDPTAAIHLTYNSLKSSLAREKTKRLPPLPQNLESLKELLNTYSPLEKFYKGAAISEIGEIALIFSSDLLLQGLSEASEIYVDGTFSVNIFF